MAVGFELSPDGRYLAIAANDGTGSRIWIHPLDSLESRALPGTEGAVSPFWSPDGSSVGFSAGGKLKRVSIAGGPPQTICDVGGVGTTGAWSTSGDILFTSRGSLLRVPAAGGRPTQVADGSAVRRYSSPTFLPDGRHFLFSDMSGTVEVSGVYYASLDGSPPVRLLPDRVNAIHMPGTTGRPGYLLFLRESTLMAQRFDPERGQLSGEIIPVADRILTLGTLRGAFTASASGVLAYGSGTEASRTLVWVDQEGKELESSDAPSDYRDLRLSPDERRIVIDRSMEGNSDIWVMDMARHVLYRLTSDPAVDNLPIWSPDGSRVLFPSNRSGSFDLYVKSAAGTGQEQVLVKMGTPTGWATDWSRDGKFILYEMPGADTGEDLWIAPQFGDGKPYPYLHSPFNEQSGRFSPDGHWIAYVSDESGRNEVYVQAFPLSGERQLISNAGGTEPQWRGDGSELFYVAGDRNLMAVPVKLGTTFQPGVPKPLGLIPGNGNARWTYAISKDGQRILKNKASGEMNPITVVLNWEAGLKK